MASACRNFKCPLYILLPFHIKEILVIIVQIADEFIPRIHHGRFPGGMPRPPSYSANNPDPLSREISSPHGGVVRFNGEYDKDFNKIIELFLPVITFAIISANSIVE
jgi:hypothetical protein